MFQFGSDQFARPGVQYSRTLLTSNPDDINNAYWFKDNTTVTTGRTDPYGGTTAEGLFETTATSTNFNIGKGNPFANLTNGTRYLQEAIVKPIGASRYLLMTAYAASFASGMQIVFDVNDAQPGSIALMDGSGFYGTDLVFKGADISPFGGGYMRCRMIYSAASNNAFDGCFFGITSSATSAPSRTGDAAKGMDFFHAALYSVP